MSELNEYSPFYKRAPFGIIFCRKKEPFKLVQLENFGFCQLLFARTYILFTITGT